jgi:tetratricopeptide (TPR) repeat protein
MLARRMWEAGDSIGVVELFARKVSPANAAAAALTTAPLATSAAPADDDVPSDVLGIRGISVQAVGLKDAADKIVQLLKSRDQDRVALAWATILGQEDPMRLLTACQQALEQSKRDRYLRYFMGEAYARLGETELALRVWREAAEANYSWPLPLVRQSQELLRLGRCEQAYGIAQVALARAPKYGPGQYAFLRAWTTCIDQGLMRETGDQLLSLLASVAVATTQPAASATSQPAVASSAMTKELPPEVTTLRVTVLARLGRDAEAKKEMAATLASATAINERLLLEYAEQSARLGLDLEDACLARCQRDHGMSADLALAMAVRQWRLKKPDEGMKLLAAARNTAGGDSALLPWQIAWAKYLELTAHPDAKQAFIKLAEGNPNDIGIQKMMLAVASVRDAYDFRARAIERLRKLAGEQSLTWQVAQARMLLDKASDEAKKAATTARDEAKNAELAAQQHFAEASNLLRDVVTRAPNWVDARELYASVLARENKIQEAIEQYRLARDLRPQSADLAMSLASLYQANGEARKAKDLLDQIAAAPLTQPREVNHMAELLAEQGESMAAIDLLKQRSERDPRADFMLAMLYRRVNQLDKAGEVLQKLASHNPDLQVILLNADLLAQQGKSAEAEQVLNRLDTLTLPPGLLEVAKAEHFERRGLLEKAIEILTPATVRVATNASLWRKLLAYEVMSARPERAQKVLDQAMAALPNDPSIQAIEQKKNFLKVTDPEFQLLVLAIITPDGNSAAAAADALKAAAMLGPEGEPLKPKERKPTPEEVSQKLAEVGRRYPRFWQVQVYLAERYLKQAVEVKQAHDLKLREVEALKQVDAQKQAEAQKQADSLKGDMQKYAASGTTAAAYAAQTAPNLADSYRLLVASTALGERWDESLDAARKWRERTLGEPLRADLAISAALIQLKRPTEAVEQLRPYTRDKSSAEYREVASTLDVAESAAGRQSTATLFEPLLTQGREGRMRWMMHALRYLQPAEAAVWLRRAAEKMPPQDEMEHIALSEAWDALATATRDKDPEYSRQARAVLEPFASKPDASNLALASMAARLERAGDTAGAMAFYRRALAQQPSPVAQNNLAMLIVQTNGNLEEARRLIDSAIAQRPQLPSLYDTKATVLEKSGDVPGALQCIYRAQQLRPEKVEYRIHVAELLLRSGDRAKAKETVNDLDKMMIVISQSLPEPLDTRLKAVRAALAERAAAAAAAAAAVATDASAGAAAGVVRAVSK